MQTKVMVALFGPFAEVERDLISERTRERLIAARLRESFSAAQEAHWVDQSSMVKKMEIQTLLDKKVSKASIAKIMGISRTPFTISSAREALINT
jgi:DNA invertase Pin-like site-specific DNA recombinase